MLALDELMASEKIDLLFDTLFCSAVMRDGTCEAIVVEDKSGRGAFAARCFVDATEDADLAARCGLPTAEQENWLSYWMYSTSVGAMERAVAEGRVQRAIRLEELGANARGKGAPEGSPRYCGTDSRDITRFVLAGRAMALRKVKARERGKDSLLSLPTMPQVRTTRRIVGRYTLGPADVGREFADSVGCVADSAGAGPVPEVPYRCLQSPGAGNVLFAGRCIASEDDAWEVTRRVIPGVAMTGQAAGTAAALAVRRGCSVQDLDVGELQDTLYKAGVDRACPAPDG